MGGVQKLKGITKAKDDSFNIETSIVRTVRNNGAMKINVVCSALRPREIGDSFQFVYLP